MATTVSDAFRDDSALVRAVRSGDPDALRVMYDRFGPLVYAIALRLTGARPDAEDVLHDFFVALPESLRRYEARGSLEGWIRRVAARTALSSMRRRGRRREDPLHDTAPAQRPRVAARAESMVDRHALERALGELSEPLRLVFVLKEIEGHSHEEIAALLGIRRGTSEVRLHRAKKRLRRLLGDR